MSKGFWIFLAVGLAVVGGLIFTMLTATQGAHLRLEGKILKVRVLALPGEGGASIVVVDFRATNPRFSSENLAINLAPVETLSEMAAAKGCRPGQLALAWLLAQPAVSAVVIGPRRLEHLEPAVAALDVHLSEDEAATIAALL